MRQPKFRKKTYDSRRFLVSKNKTNVLKVTAGGFWKKIQLVSLSIRRNDSKLPNCYCDESFQKFFGWFFAQKFEKFMFLRLSCCTKVLNWVDSIPNLLELASDYHDKLTLLHIFCIVGELFDKKNI